MSNLLIQFDQQPKIAQRMSGISFNQFQFKYRFDCQLSQGSFGKVCRIQEISTQKYYALKKVTVKKKQQLEDIQNEIKLLLRFKHPFVVQIKETYNIQIKSGFAKPIGEVGLVMELAKCSLEHIIRTKNVAGSPQFILDQTAGIIQILFTLQKQNIAHRDIKPANILVFEGNENSMYWKLADFGLALDLNKAKEQQNFAGSFQYASPILKRKFKYPNLKIKCNPFKNDVFSLGVTLLETITGVRQYNQTSADKLHHICSTQPLLAKLIDMMLEEDEQKRPCFKQLMMLLERDFKNFTRKMQQQNKDQPSSFHKQTQSTDYRTQQQIYDKTVVKNSQLNEQIIAKKTIIDVGKPIQCVANLDGFIMCGCDNGQIVFVKHGEIVEVGFVHQKIVSQFFVDDRENIWSVGGDSCIKKWSKNNLIKALISQTQQVAVMTDNLFKKRTKKTKIALELKQTFYENIQLPFNHPCGISSLFAIDAGHFAVGYYDGYIYVRWNGGEYHARLFGRPATAIKFCEYNKKLYLCALDGQVKILETTTLTPENRIFYRKGYSFVNMHISSTQHQPCILNLLTLEGRQLLLKPNMEPIFERPMEKNPLMTSIENNKNCYILMENGDIFDSSQEKLVSLGSKGWNCLGVSTERELIVGNFLGQIAIVQW